MILGRFLEALAEILSIAVNVYILIIIIRSIISWMGRIPPNQFIMLLRRLTDPVFRFVHRKLPFTIIGGIDISPIIIVAALYFIDIFLFRGILRDIARQMILN